MRAGNRRQSFPGTDHEASDLLASDVATDEQEIIAAVREAREREGVSLEALGFLLGTEAAQLSRHLKGTCGTSLTNYLRIARALGYRSRIVLDKAEPIGSDVRVISNLKVSPHRVINPRFSLKK